MGSDGGQDYPRPPLSHPLYPPLFTYIKSVWLSGQGTGHYSSYFTRESMAVGIQLEIVPMLGLRRRRWANIVLAKFPRL